MPSAGPLLKCSGERRVRHIAESIPRSFAEVGGRAGHREYITGLAREPRRFLSFVGRGRDI
jgi:hypothetical protein